MSDNAKKTAVVICPGRGTYNKSELGMLKHHFTDRALLDRFEDIRREAGQKSLAELDGAERYSIAMHTRGDNASALIYAASYADFQALSGVEVVAVTGNSMGWYSALGCAGAVSAVDGFRLCNTMGTLMQERMIGGQVVYPFVSDDWMPNAARKQELLSLVDEISNKPGHFLALSIDLGGMLVLGGNAKGLDAFEAAVPPVQDRFPLRLANHAAFHTELQKPVAEEGRGLIGSAMFNQPQLPLIDGRGNIWWPGATDIDELWRYTLGHQVVEPYDFTRTITQAAREFAPDLFIVTGPGTTLGGAVAQSLIQADWFGMQSKADFQKLQKSSPFLVSMGMDDQRATVTDGG